MAEECKECDCEQCRFIRQVLERTGENGKAQLFKQHGKLVQAEVNEVLRVIKKK